MTNTVVQPTGAYNTVEDANGWFYTVTETGGTAPGVVTDGSTSTYISMTGQGETVPEVWMKLPATVLPSNPLERLWRFTMRQRAENVLGGPFSPYALAPVPTPASGDTVWAYICTIPSYPPAVTPQYYARLEVSQPSLGLSEAFQSFQVDMTLEPGRTWSEFETIMAGEQAWLAMFHENGGYDDGAAPQELTYDWAGIEFVYVTGVPPLRQNQRDDLRENQRTSRQLTVRQRGYL